MSTSPMRSGILHVWELRMDVVHPAPSLICCLLANLVPSLGLVGQRGSIFSQHADGRTRRWRVLACACFGVQAHVCAHLCVQHRSRR